MEGGGRSKGSPPLKPFKFSVYQNPTFSAALTANSLQPTRFNFLFNVFLSSASAFLLLSVISREDWFIDSLKLNNLSQQTAYFFAKALETVIGFVLLGTIFALFKAVFLHRGRFKGNVPAISISKETNVQSHLSDRQLGLLGMKSRVDQAISETSKKPPKSKAYLPSSPSNALVPLHSPISISSYSSQKSIDKLNSSAGSKMQSILTPSKSPHSSSSRYLAPGVVSPLSSQSSPGMDSMISTPWSNKRSSSAKGITSEEDLERFLAEMDEKITESAGKLATPPPTIRSFGVASPTIASSATTSGTTRSTPLRPVRMSPSSQKMTTPPKKGEGELPPPMSIEESVEAFKHLEIYPQIEQWRDHLRQWFSSVLINPLLNKVETSHIQVMQAAGKLGISIVVSPIGSDLQTNGTPAIISSLDRSKEWQPALVQDEDGHLHQLRATLLQSIGASMPKLSVPNLQQSPQQQNILIPIMQECVNAIAEHQRLHALMKGEWVKGLLPQSSVPADYTVHRIRELAEGTCLKNYKYLVKGDDSNKKKKWTAELPTDSHLLLYLFCAFLEHPKWMLHLDPASYAGAQSSKNPLFLAALPPKERSPDKYIAVTSVVPSTLHPGACLLVVGRQMPPIFGLYWDKKLQFSLQGRTALWDSILVLCHRIKVGYGGVVRGMHLGSSALNILPVLESETED